MASTHFLSLFSFLELYHVPININLSTLKNQCLMTQPELPIMHWPAITTLILKINYKYSITK